MRFQPVSQLDHSLFAVGQHFLQISKVDVQRVILFFGLGELRGQLGALFLKCRLGSEGSIQVFADGEELSFDVFQIVTHLDFFVCAFFLHVQQVVHDLVLIVHVVEQKREALEYSNDEFILLLVVFGRQELPHRL